MIQAKKFYEEIHGTTDADNLNKDAIIKLLEQAIDKAYKLGYAEAKRIALDEIDKYFQTQN